MGLLNPKVKVEPSLNADNNVGIAIIIKLTALLGCFFL